MIILKSMMRLGRLQQDNEMITQQCVCLLNYQYFKDHHQLIAVDIRKQKELDADPRDIQQIELYGKLDTNSKVCTLLQKSKEAVLEF